MGKAKTQQLIAEAKHLLIKGDKYQAYRRLLMIEELIAVTAKPGDTDNGQA